MESAKVYPIPSGAVENQALTDDEKETLRKLLTKRPAWPQGVCVMSCHDANQIIINKLRNGELQNGD